MKYLGAITNDYDLVTKKYVDDAAKVVQTLTSGTEIGSVGGTKLYAPQGGGGGGTVTSVGVSNATNGGLSISGSPVTSSGDISIGHSNVVTAGTIGSSSASQGSTIAIPYATYDSNGHITSKGTHTHTVTGFLTEEEDPIFSASEASGISSSDISNWNGKADTTGFFKIVEVSFTQATISAHSYASGTSHSVPSASRPSGMTLVGIVGFRSSIYRLYPYTYYVDGAHSFWMGIANATASSSGEATIRVELLYIKATSA